MTTKAEAYNTAISNIKATPPNFDDLTVIWTKIVTDRRLFSLKEKYVNANLTDSQLQIMASIDAELYRKSLNDEAFKGELLQLHEQAIAAACRQLEIERDSDGGGGGWRNRKFHRPGSGAIIAEP